MDLSGYLEDYKTEAKGHIKNATDAMLKLEKNRGDEEAINTAFLAMHTLKSMSAAMEFEKLATLCHKIEDALDLVRKNKKDPDSGFIDVILEALDSLGAQIGVAGTRKMASDFSGIEKNLALLESIPAKNRAPQPQAHDPIIPVAEETQTVRVPMEKLDLLLGLVGELVIN